MAYENLHGILPALMTAFTDDGAHIDRARIRKLVRHLIDSGVHGLYVGGSSGEMLLCSTEERMELLETVLDVTQNAGRPVAVIAHVGSAGTRETLALARHAARSGADAVSSVTPFYFSYGFAEVRRFYEELAAVELPVVIYNIPARTGMTLNEAQLGTLLSIPNVAGMKFTSSDFFLLERLITGHPDKIFYNGSDEMLLSGLAAGAHGGIGTTYNFQPARMLDIYRLYHEGKMTEALANQREANAMIEAVLGYGVLPACKALLKIGGLDYGICRAPFLPLSDEQYTALAHVAAEKLGEGFMVRCPRKVE